MKTIRQAAPEWEAPLAAWIANYRLSNMSPGTIELRLYQVRHFANWCGKHWQDVTGDDLTVYLSSHAWAPATTSARRAGLRKFFEWCEKTGRLDKSPARDIPGVKVPTPKPKPIPEDALAEAIANAPDERIRMALRLAGGLGLRRTEVCQIHRDDILTTNEGHLLKVLGKGNKERFVPMPDALARDLVAFIDRTPGDYAFPIGDHHVSPHWIGTLVSRALPDGYTMHKLRHRALTQAYRSSRDLLLTSKIAGHSSTATTATYYVEVDYGAMRGLMDGMAV